MNVDPLGLPGEPGRIVVVNRFDDPDDPRNQGAPAGLPGLYRVVLTLQRPGRPLTAEYAASFEAGLEGDSHLAITKPAYATPIDATQIQGVVDSGRAKYRWNGFPNRRGYLAKIVVDPFHASNMKEAEQQAYRAVTPALSDLSAHLDIPLQVAQVDVREERTGNTQASFVNAWQQRPLVGEFGLNLSVEYRSVTSIYREALESSSHVYRYLCFFKVIEAVLNLRKKRERQAKKDGEAFSRLREVVPEDEEDFVPWLNGINAPRPPRWDELTLDSIFHPEAHGKTFEELAGPGKKRGGGGVLRTLRDDVAHGLWGEPGDPITMSADELRTSGFP